MVITPASFLTIQTASFWSSFWTENGSIGPNTDITRSRARFVDAIPQVGTILKMWFPVGAA